MRYVKTSRRFLTRFHIYYYLYNVKKKSNNLIQPQTFYKFAKMILGTSAIKTYSNKLGNKNYNQLTR